MQIRLVDYKEGVPVEVHEEYNPKQWDVEFVDLKYTTPVGLDATVEKVMDTVTFRGHLTSSVEHICGRCLKKVPGKLDQPFELYYETQGKEIIDTVDDLRETLILDHALAFVCSEECKGLCPHCGINLNESSCHCKAEMKTNPFSKLKKFRSREREE